MYIVLHTCYTVAMKISKTFRLSEEAVAELDKQANATQYLEDLLLRGGERVYEVVPLHQLEALLADIKQSPVVAQPPQPLSPAYQSSSEFVPKPPNPLTGYPCCERPAPCKHWAWDDSVPAWKNSITGATRDE